MTGTLPPLLGSVVGGARPERRFLRVHMDPMLLCQGKGLVLPTLNIDTVSEHIRFLLISLPNNDMSKISPFAIHKILIEIGGEPKSVKRLRSGDLLIETTQKHLLLFFSFPHRRIQLRQISYLRIFNKTNTQIESRLPEPISSAAAPDNILNTSASSLSAETRSLTTEIQSLVPLPESVPTTSNSEHSNAPEIPQYVKRNSRNRRKRPKVHKAEIEIKMAPHRPEKSAPKELTDDEDMITYGVEEEELEPDPAGRFPIQEDPLNFPKGYLRSLTPSRYRNSKG
ncbi:hypothetical protein TNCV_3897641 [Trichonephila clavipes]|nr:hypothetical protein TNCV_3897641 [Trichonephila clavipes]